MITRAEVEKLGALHVVEPTMLSLYLAVPPSADLAVLCTRAGELIAAAEAVTGQAVEPWAGERVRDKLATCARDWSGRTMAVFACAGSGLLEAIPLPCPLPERAVLGVRPHIRPLLLARQRCPAYRVAVADRHRLWLFSVDGDDVAGTWLPVARYAQDTAAELACVAGGAEPGSLVVGGREDDVERLLGSASPAVRKAVAGSFTADPRTLTAAGVRDLTAPIVARWADRRAWQLAAGILAMPPGGQSVIGLPACLSAVSASTVPALVVPVDGLAPGYECGRCGTLSLEADGCCPDWGTAALKVPDVIEEMVSRTLEDGGEVVVTADGSSPVAARLTRP
jgi:hypothetical protein